ncbi:MULTISPECIES: EAL domain-containing protein [Halomonadaceae]|uniref:EAL domain-containing protein n=1 Tax=Halomonadaceae TaxID=28256 RepID=UPI00159A9090|nr:MULTISPECIES: EAL domain-containing protein [Halomonas]QJQ95253.1 EAL domain-containing protein [Halomonas sp. PA5]
MSQDLPVARIMQAGLLTCTPDTPLCEAAKRMAERRCSSILICEGQLPVGLWTEHDTLSVDFASPEAVRIPIREVMSSPVASLPSDTPVGEASIRFREEGRRHFLIVDNEGLPLGILSQTDVAFNQGLESYLKLREVRGAMRDSPLIIEGTLRLSEAARAMRQVNCDAAVVNCEMRGLGIITERDLVRFVARHPGDTPIGDLASRPLLTVKPDDVLIHARDLLLDRRIRHLAVVDDNQRVIGLLGFKDMLVGSEHLYLKDLRDALEQRDRALAQSRQNLQLAERVIESSLEGIIITDADSRIEFVNPAFTHLTGYRLDEIIGRTPEVLASGRHDRAFYRQMWDVIERHGYWRGEIWNRRKSGELYLELLTITAISDEQGNPAHYAGLFRDITHIRENEEQIRQLAYYDPLTRLPNRRLLEDRLSLAIRHAHRNQLRLAVLFFDLDHFKQVNDTLGHAVGDELLLLLAERLRHLLREDDTLARLGGDEFVVLLPDIHAVEEVTRVARRLIEAISEPCVIGPHEFRVGCSLGISLYPDDESGAEGLVRNADAAMYRAKQEGRNTYRLYTAEMNFQANNQLALETSLRNTVESGEGLEVVYQPLFERDGGALHSAEALLRWHHPERGDISPDDFIPLAESSGLIVPLGERVIHMVCRQIKEWKAAGLAPVPVAINLSARQFWQAGLTESIRGILAKYDLEAGLIGFELTESTLLDKRQCAIATLQSLRELGCPIAIDDFGTGYSSLSYLQALPVTSLKIDRAFIQRLESAKRRDGAIVAAISGLAHELDLTVIAEGVETEAQWNALGLYPVDLVQGFLTGRPVNAAQFQRDYLQRTG